jgi:hypothetical protein
VFAINALIQAAGGLMSRGSAKATPPGPG